jgi:hypothetical protein
MPNPLDLTNQHISDTYQRILQTDSGFYYDGLGNTVSIGTGSMGPQGFQGSNSVGPQGFQGPRGDLGDYGPQGWQGSQGWQGWQGPRGDLGLSGLQGFQGPQGFQGWQGVQGPQGFQGWQGAQGVQGTQGPEGFQGSTGPAGSSQLSTFEITTSSYTADFTYSYYGVLFTGGPCTITLPIGVSGTDAGKSITIADEVGLISNYSNGIYVSGDGGQLIDGNATVAMKTDWMSLTFLFRNDKWKII